MTGAKAITDIKAILLAQAVEFVGDRTPQEISWFRGRAQELLAQTTEAELMRIATHVGTDDHAWGYHPPHEFARRIHHAMAEVSLTDDSGLQGAQHLLAVRDERLLLLPNHVSYSDANLIEILLHRAGFDDVCQRLTVIAGPKVYSDPTRRFASLCFGTIKTAQSSSRSSGEAVMRPRDVARIARQTIAVAFERVDAGDALMVFAEGARSRSATLQPLLPAIARYCERGDLWLLPVGVTGTEQLMAVNEAHLHRTRVNVALGEPIRAAELRERCGRRRPEIVDALGHAIAAVLPPEYRGVYA